MGKPRILLADDHAVLIEALKVLLEPSCEIVGTATEGHGLIAKATELQPEVIVADIYMPRWNWLEGCKRLRQEAPESKVIVLTVSEDSETAAEAMRSGVNGYVLKKDAATELLPAIQTAAAGRVYSNAMSNV